MDLSSVEETSKASVGDNSLSVISLNVNGMRDPKRRRLMFDYLSKHVYDIALLQDTRIVNKRECLQWSAES